MPDPTKVPEAVLEAYQDGARKIALGGKRFTAPEMQEAGLAAAIDKYIEILSSARAVRAGAIGFAEGFDGHHPCQTNPCGECLGDSERVIEAAIDSVMKGEGDVRD